jgi:DNA-binding response OmpR family regulator
MKREEDKQKQILIVDDETRMRDLLRLVLESRGYSVAEAEDGLQALKLFVAEPPDMVILDVMMPVMDGFICCRKLREYSACPILMLTAKGEDYDQVRGLDCGADDYIVKPFAPMVLAARVEALFRRSAAMPRNVFGSMRIDTAAREVTVDGVSVPLSRKEYELLVYLAENDNISLSRDQILEFVWGYDYLGSSNTVDTHINRLRSKLGKCGSYITTLRGFGYRFEIGT